MLVRRQRGRGAAEYQERFSTRIWWKVDVGNAGTMKNVWVRDYRDENDSKVT